MRAPEPVVLPGHGVVLEPLAPRHVPELWEAGRGACDSACCSILSSEWPDVRDRLPARLGGSVTGGAPRLDAPGAGLP